GVWARSTLVEAGGGLQAPGDSVHLTCHGHGSDFSRSAVLWYRQAAGASPEWLSYIRIQAVSDLAAALKGRAATSRDNSRAEASLSLRDLSLQDSGRYFCALRMF
ncbi:HV349 protein, partial [Urocolius indicus]|nr:HV349 protein [Urocolius indicus]